MRFIAACAALAAILLPWPASAGDRPPVDTAIVFLVDVSGSMNPNEVRTARQAHAHALVSADVLSAVRDGEIGRIAVAYVEFGQVAVTRIDWTTIETPSNAEDLANQITALSPDIPHTFTAATAVGTGLLEADRLMGTAPSSLRLVVDIVGDGISMEGPPVELGREALLSRGVTINAMPVLMDNPDRNLAEWYAENVAGGPGHFTMPIAGIDALPMALRSKIVQELY